MWDPQLRCKCYRDTLLWKNFFVKITYWVNVWFSLMIKERLSWSLQVPVFFGWQLFTVPDEQDAKLACKQWNGKTPLLPACKKFCSPYITFNLKPVWLLRVFFTHFFPVFKFYSLLDISTDQVFQPDFVRTRKVCKISITVCNGWGRKSMYSVPRQKWKMNSFWKNVTQQMKPTIYVSIYFVNISLHFSNLTESVIEFWNTFAQYLLQLMLLVTSLSLHLPVQKREKQRFMTC